MTDDAAQYPFLASLPPHVGSMREVEMVNGKKARIGGNSIRDFLMTYCACFAAVAVFIA